MPVKAGGRGAALGAGGEEGAGDADPPDAPLLPHPMRLKYTIGKIIGNIHYLKKIKYWWFVGFCLKVQLFETNDLQKILCIL